MADSTTQDNKCPECGRKMYFGGNGRRMWQASYSLGSKVTDFCDDTCAD